MTSHLGLLVVFAVLVAPVFAAIHRDDFASGRAFALRVCAALVGGAFLLSWVLYLVYG